MPVCTKLTQEEESRAVPGRPDFGWNRKERQSFGKTRAKKFPPYVFSVHKSACLVHRVLHVELDWYAISRGGHGLVRMQRPVAFAHTCCGTFYRLSGHKVRTCLVPNPEALLCKACHGEGRNFSRVLGARDRDTGLTRREAGVRLGCVVQGY